MTHEEFKRLPFLLMEYQATEVMGYAPRTLWKLVACGHLEEVQPAGSGTRRFRKVQVALLAGLDWEDGAEEFAREPFMMKEQSVCRWTGYAPKTLCKIAQAGGLVLVRPAGMETGKFRKVEVAELLGLGRFV